MDNPSSSSDSTSPNNGNNNSRSRIVITTDSHHHESTSDNINFTTDSGVSHENNNNNNNNNKQQAVLLPSSSESMVTTNSHTNSTSASSSSSLLASIFYKCAWLRSVRTILILFFTSILICCWISAPISFLMYYNREIDFLVEKLSEETALAIQITLQREFSISESFFLAQANWSKTYGSPGPGTNSLLRRRMRTQMTKYVISQLDSSGFVYFVQRFAQDRGSRFLGLSATNEILVAQYCCVSNGIWSSTMTQATRENVSDCETVAINRTSKWFLPQGTVFDTPYQLNPRSFIAGTVWNYTADVTRINPFLFNNNSVVSGEVGFTDNRDADGSGFFGIVFGSIKRTTLSSNPSLFSSMELSVIDLSNFQTVLKNLLPDAPGARAFAMDLQGRVVFWSHGPSVELLSLSNTGGMLYPNCYRGFIGSLIGCLYNLSDYEPYGILRYQRNIELEMYGDALTNNFFGRRVLLDENGKEIIFGTQVIEFEGTAYVANHQVVSFISGVLDLYIFLPVEFWTKATRNSIIVALTTLTIVIIVGFFASWFAVKTISSRIENLAEAMAEDPFSGPPLLVKKKKKNKNSNSKNDSGEQFGASTGSFSTSMDSSRRSSLSRSGSSSYNTRLDSEEEEHVNNNDNNNETSSDDQGSSDSETFWEMIRRVFFVELEEIFELEEGFTQLRGIIDQLRSFLPLTQIKKSERKNEANRKSNAAHNNQKGDKHKNKDHHQDVSESDNDGKNDNSNTNNNNKTVSRKKPNASSSNSLGGAGGGSDIDQDEDISACDLIDGSGSGENDFRQRQDMMTNDKGNNNHNDGAAGLIDNDDFVDASQLSPALHNSLYPPNATVKINGQTISNIDKTTAKKYINNKDDNTAYRETLKQLNSQALKASALKVIDEEEDEDMSGQLKCSPSSNNLPPRSVSVTPPSTPAASGGAAAVVQHNSSATNSAATSNVSTANPPSTPKFSPANTNTPLPSFPAVDSSDPSSASINNPSHQQNQNQLKHQQGGSNSASGGIHSNSEGLGGGAPLSNENSGNYFDGDHHNQRQQQHSNSTASLAVPVPTSPVSALKKSGTPRRRGNNSNSNASTGVNNMHSNNNDNSNSNSSRKPQLSVKFSAEVEEALEKKKNEELNSVGGVMVGDKMVVSSQNRNQQGSSSNSAQKKGDNNNKNDNSQQRQPHPAASPLMRLKNSSNDPPQRYLIGSISIMGTLKIAKLIDEYLCRNNNSSWKMIEKNNNGSSSSAFPRNPADADFNTRNHKDSLSTANNNINSNNSTPNSQEEAEQDPRYQMIERARFIVDTMLEGMQSTGANIIEYRNDVFIVALRLSKRMQSKLAFRFIAKMISAAHKIANHKYQKRWNVGPNQTICMTGGFAIGTCRLLNTTATFSDVLVRPMTILGSPVCEALKLEFETDYQARLRSVFSTMLASENVKNQQHSSTSQQQQPSASNLQTTRTSSTASLSSSSGKVTATTSGGSSNTTKQQQSNFSELVSFNEQEKKQHPKNIPRKVAETGNEDAYQNYETESGSSCSSSVVSSGDYGDDTDDVSRSNNKNNINNNNNNSNDDTRSSSSAQSIEPINQRTVRNNNNNKNDDDDDDENVAAATGGNEINLEEGNKNNNVNGIPTASTVDNSFFRDDNLSHFLVFDVDACHDALGMLSRQLATFKSAAAASVKLKRFRDSVVEERVKSIISATTTGMIMPPSSSSVQQQQLYARTQQSTPSSSAITSGNHPATAAAADVYRYPGSGSSSGLIGAASSSTSGGAALSSSPVSLDSPAAVQLRSELIRQAVQKPGSFFCPGQLQQMADTIRDTLAMSPNARILEARQMGYQFVGTVKGKNGAPQNVFCVRDPLPLPGFPDLATEQEAKLLAEARVQHEQYRLKQKIKQERLQKQAEEQRLQQQYRLAQQQQQQQHERQRQQALQKGMFDLQLPVESSNSSYNNNNANNDVNTRHVSAGGGHYYSPLPPGLLGSNQNGVSFTNSSSGNSNNNNPNLRINTIRHHVNASPNSGTNNNNNNNNSGTMGINHQRGGQQQNSIVPQQQHSEETSVNGVTPPDFDDEKLTGM